MSDEQAVRQVYERVICVYGVTRWEILEYKGAHDVLGTGKSPAEAWADARSKWEPISEERTGTLKRK